MRLPFFFLPLIPAFLAACRPEAKAPDTAFYHWQTEWALTDEEESYLEKLGVRRLYVRFFDIDWDLEAGQPVPTAQLQSEQMDGSSRQIVPAVFITNRTFLQLPEDQAGPLGRRIFEKLKDMAGTALWASIPEVQIDCDWSGQTRDNYFRLLQTLRTLLRTDGIALSATIRLHQVRYFRQTGVPPVDRGMLMFYNMGDLDAWETPNSILDPGLGTSYLQGSRNYPLPLDLALPVFSWGVLFRDGRLIRLINNLREEDLTDTARFRKIDANRFQVIKSTYLQGYYLYEGDRIRTEAAGSDLLLQSAQALASRLPAGWRTVAFYHLDTATIKHVPYEVLETVCRILEKP